MLIVLIQPLAFVSQPRDNTPTPGGLKVGSRAVT